MVVGIYHLDLLLPQGSSLKSKRKVIKSLIARTRNKFNVSVSEVGGYNLWQRAQIGVCIVGNDKRFVNASLDNIINFIESTGLVEIIRTELEILNFNYDTV